ncbi:hypothetical protein CEXT_277381, partial [Caerostris extrusa]
ASPLGDAGVPGRGEPVRADQDGHQRGVPAAAAHQLPLPPARHHRALWTTRGQRPTSPPPHSLEQLLKVDLVQIIYAWYPQILQDMGGRIPQIAKTWAVRTFLMFLGFPTDSVLNDGFELSPDQMHLQGKFTGSTFETLDRMTLAVAV